MATRPNLFKLQDANLDRQLSIASTMARASRVQEAQAPAVLVDGTKIRVAKHLGKCGKHLFQHHAGVPNTGVHLWTVSFSTKEIDGNWWNFSANWNWKPILYPPNAALWGFTQWFVIPQKKHKLHPVKASKSSTKKCYYVPCPSLQTNKKNATKSNLHQQSFVFFLPAPSHGGALIFFGVGMAWAFTVVSSAKAAAIAAPTPKSGSSGTKDSAVGSSGTKEPKPGKASKIETSATAWVLAQKGMGGGIIFLWGFFQVINRSFLTKKIILGFWGGCCASPEASASAAACAVSTARNVWLGTSHLYAVELPFHKIQISKMQVERQKHSTWHIYVIP